MAKQEDAKLIQVQDSLAIAMTFRSIFQTGKNQGGTPNLFIVNQGKLCHGG